MARPEVTLAPRRRRSAKIVATLGPASSTPDQIAALFASGVDVFRLNFSHGTQEDHKARLDTIRALEARTGRPIGVMADLQGPKLRLGTFTAGKIALAQRQLLLDDGNVRLKVDTCGKDFAETTVMAGSALSDRKGVNVPGVVLPLSALTPKDRSDLAYALKLGVDWIALSFVQRPDDVAEARKLIAGKAAVLVKLEKPAAIQRLQEIIELSDAVMVARGDLGVEMPPEDVPPIQPHILQSC